ncbi:hypothetical protein IGK74_002313 [Enterococcus sp. AZ150]|uniref:hypothetical protein n=1 Tax=Enterococcus sp. AZ150 TaxID=2774866 RepID=UPI003F1F2045
MGISIKSLFKFDKKTIPFKDENFLKVEWDKNFGTQKSVHIKEIIESIDSNTSDKDYKISKTLPYLTFYQAEQFFSELKNNLSEISPEKSAFEFKQIEIVHQTEEEFSTDNELFVSPFIIDESYQNILLTLIETMFISPSFEEYTYEQKKNYFVHNIYTSYANSLEIDPEILPTFPTKEQVESNDFFNNQSIQQEHYSKVVQQDTSPSINQEHTQEFKKLEVEQPEKYSSNYVDKFVEEKISEPIQSNINKPTAMPNVQTKEIINFKDNNVNEQQYSRSSKHYNQDQPHLDIQFPIFPVDETLLHIQNVEKYDERYVPFVLNQLKAQLNQKILEQEALNNTLANDTLTSEQIRLEKLDQRLNLEKVLKLDKRSELKMNILSSVNLLKEKELKQNLGELEVSYDLLVEEENRRHEQALAELKNQVTERRKEIHQEVEKEYLIKAQNDYNEEFYRETNILEQTYQELQEKSSEARMLKLQKLASSFQRSALEIGNELFKNFENQLSEIKQQQELFYVQNLEYRKLEIQKELEEKNDNQVKEQIETMKQEYEGLKKLVESTKKEQKNLQTEAVLHQNKVLNDQVQFLTSVAQATATQQQGTIAKQELSKENEVTSEKKFLKPVLLGFISFLTIAGLGFFIFYNNHVQNDLIASKNDEISKQIDSISDNLLSQNKLIQQNETKINELSSKQVEAINKSLESDKKQAELFTNLDSLKQRLQDQADFQRNPIVLEINGLSNSNNSNN